MQSILKIRNLSKYYGKFKAVDDISFSLNKGDILGFLGPNGAGKTTTMRMLTGFIKPSKGNIFLHNQDIQLNLLEYKKLLGYVPEGSPLYNEMSTIDFLNFICEIRMIRQDRKNLELERVINLLKLHNVLYQKIETLSKGYKRRVGLAQSILHNPDILILDEPTDGLDPNQKNEVRKLIKKLGKEKAIIISTHILEEITALCNRTMIIAKGKLLIDDKPINILKKSSFYNNIQLAVEEKNTTELKDELISEKVCKSIEINNNLCILKSENYKTL